MANIYFCLDRLGTRYKEIASYIKSAEARLMVVLCSRKDSEAIMREVKESAHHG